MAEEWLTIADVSKRVGLAENTARRYAHLFGEYIKSRQFGRATKYAPEALEVMADISQLYQGGLSTQEIQERLRGAHALTVDIPIGQEVKPHPVVEELRQAVQQLTAHAERQEEFNRQLLERLEDRDEKLREALREIRESRLTIAAAEEYKKRWWEWWKR